MTWDHDAVAEAARSARPNSAGTYGSANCPACIDRAGKVDRKMSLRVNLYTGWYSCYRCGVRGCIEVPEEKRMLAPIAGPRLPRATEPATLVAPPEGFLPLWKEPGITSVGAEPAREYLRSRGLVDTEVWRSVGIGCCLSGKTAGRVVVPVLTETGGWLGWVARAWRPGSWRPYLNARGMVIGTTGNLFNEAALREATEAPVLIVEGVFDALALWPMAAAVLGKPTTAQVQTMRTAARPVVIVLDGDAWEEAEMLAMRLRFEGVRAGWVRLPPCKDPDEVDLAWLMDEARRSLEVG